MSTTMVPVTAAAMSNRARWPFRPLRFLRGSAVAAERAKFQKAHFYATIGKGTQPMRIWVLSFAYVSAIAGQPLTVGFKAGIPVTENFDAAATTYTHGDFISGSKTRRYTVGPSVTFSLPRRFGVEVDALYRRINYDWFNIGLFYATDAGYVAEWTSTTGNRIDVPLLLRWSPTNRVYAVTGPVFGFHYGFTQRAHTVQDLVLAGHADTYTTNKPSELQRRVSKGVTFGIGFEVSARIRIRPEIRYSYWVSPAFEPYVVLRPATSDVTLMLGWDFGGKGSEHQ